MKIHVPYGDGYMVGEINDAIPVQIVDPACKVLNKPVNELLQEALDNPIGTPRLENMVSSQDQVLIVINDHTRPGPTQEMAEAIIERLKLAGLSENQIEFIVATGSHRGSTQEELLHMVGPYILSHYKIHMHDCHKGNVYVGTCLDRLKIYVDEVVAKSKFIITTGLIVPHKTAGFSGGRKSIVPGVTALETLHFHHALPIRPMQPAVGWMEENQFHIDALQGARMVNVKFILNAVQDTQKQNVAFVAGDLELAHKKGVELSRRLNTVECNKRGDLIIVSPGGAPRDQNLYQTQKGLACGEEFCKRGEKVTFILLCRGEKGFGPELFKRWLEEAERPEEVIERFKKEGFDVGTNKAFEYARAETKGRIIVVSENLDPVELKKMMMDWAPDLQTAINMALTEKIPEQVIVLPKAVSIIPHFNDGVQVKYTE